ncbi:hypothetical protein AWC38_SpisGene17757 [Stylophora pistillata]|uniref:Uncharacterized protein n=1 Tax=Stylophora pistillata TaxID=50429 RepID=A0A2B4RNK8_STYPI|nr:hypothetical protein AWC38_SpisGene17757 [Stylophora pistillata]
MDQVKKLTEQDVEKCLRRYEASLSSKTCDTMADKFLHLSSKALTYFLPVDEGKLLKDLNDNFMVKRELGMISDGLSLKYGEYMAIALLTVKNVEVPFESPSVNDKEIDSICKETDYVVDKNLNEKLNEDLIEYLRRTL